MDIGITSDLLYTKSTSFCVKDARGPIHQRGKVVATRRKPDVWTKTLPQPWRAAFGSSTKTTHHGGSMVQDDFVRHFVFPTCRDISIIITLGVLDSVPADC
jgi:hypothetical protein